MESCIADPCCSLCRQFRGHRDMHPECLFCRRTSGIVCFEECEHCLAIPAELKIKHEKQLRKKLKTILKQSSNSTTPAEKKLYINLITESTQNTLHLEYNEEEVVSLSRIKAFSLRVNSCEKQKIPHGEREIPLEREVAHEERKIPREEQEITCEEQEIPHEEQEIPHEKQEIPHEKQEIPHEEQEIPHEEQEIPHEEQEIPHEEQEIPHEEQEIPHEEQEIPHEEQEIPHEEQEIPHEEHEIPHNKQVIPHQEQAIPHKELEISLKELEISLKEQEIPLEEQEIPHEEREIPHEEREIPHGDQEIPLKEQEILHKEREIPHKEQEIPHEVHEIPHEVQEIPHEECKIFHERDETCVTSGGKKELCGEKRTAGEEQSTPCEEQSTPCKKWSTSREEQSISCEKQAAPHKEQADSCVERATRNDVKLSPHETKRFQSFQSIHSSMPSNFCSSELSLRSNNGCYSPLVKTYSRKGFSNTSGNTLDLVTLLKKDSKSSHKDRHIISYSDLNWSNPSSKCSTPSQTAFTKVLIVPILRLSEDEIASYVNKTISVGVKATPHDKGNTGVLDETHFRKPVDCSQRNNIRDSKTNLGNALKHSKTEHCESTHSTGDMASVSKYSHLSDRSKCLGGPSSSKSVPMDVTALSNLTDSCGAQRKTPEGFERSVVQQQSTAGSSKKLDSKVHYKGPDDTIIKSPFEMLLYLRNMHMTHLDLSMFQFNPDIHFPEDSPISPIKDSLFNLLIQSLDVSKEVSVVKSFRSPLIDLPKSVGNCASHPTSTPSTTSSSSTVINSTRADPVVIRLNSSSDDELPCSERCSDRIGSRSLPAVSSALTPLTSPHDPEEASVDEEEEEEEEGDVRWLGDEIVWKECKRKKLYSLVKTRELPKRLTTRTTGDDQKKISTSPNAGLPNETRTALQSTARKSSSGFSSHYNQASKKIENSQKMLTARKSSKAAPNSSFLSLPMLRPSIINTVHTKLAASTSQNTPILLKPVRISHEEPLKSILGMTTALPVHLKLPTVNLKPTFKPPTSNHDTMQPVIAVKFPQNYDRSRLGLEKELRVVLPKLNQFNDGATSSNCLNVHKTNISHTAASRASCHELRKVRVELSCLRLVRLKDSDERVTPTSAEVAAKALPDCHHSSGSVAQLLKFRMPSSMQLASSQKDAKSIPQSSIDSKPSCVILSKISRVSEAGCIKSHSPNVKIISKSVESMEDTSVCITNQLPKINALLQPEKPVSVVLASKKAGESCFQSMAQLKQVHVQISRLQQLTMTASFCKQHGLSKQCGIKVNAQLWKLAAPKQEKSSIAPSGSMQSLSTFSENSPANVKMKSFRSKGSKSAQTLTKDKNTDESTHQNVGISAKTDSKRENKDETASHAVLTTPKMNNSNLNQTKTLSSLKKLNTQKWYWNDKKLKLESLEKRSKAFVRVRPSIKTDEVLTVQHKIALSTNTKTVAAPNEVSYVTNEAGSACKNLSQATTSPTVKKAGPASKNEFSKVTSPATKSSHHSPLRIHSVEHYAATSEQAPGILKAKRVSFCDEVRLCLSSAGESESDDTSTGQDMRRSSENNSDSSDNDGHSSSSESNSNSCTKSSTCDSEDIDSEDSLSGKCHEPMRLIKRYNRLRLQGVAASFAGRGSVIKRTPQYTGRNNPVRKRLMTVRQRMIYVPLKKRDSGDNDTSSSDSDSDDVSESAVYPGLLVQLQMDQCKEMELIVTDDNVFFKPSTPMVESISAGFTHLLPSTDDGNNLPAPLSCTPKSLIVPSNFLSSSFMCSQSSEVSACVVTSATIPPAPATVALQSPAVSSSCPLSHTPTCTIGPLTTISLNTPACITSSSLAVFSTEKVGAPHSESKRIEALFPTACAAVADSMKQPGTESVLCKGDSATGNTSDAISSAISSALVSSCVLSAKDLSGVVDASDFPSVVEPHASNLVAITSTTPSSSSVPTISIPSELSLPKSVSFSSSRCSSIPYPILMTTSKQNSTALTTTSPSAAPTAALPSAAPTTALHSVAPPFFAPTTALPYVAPTTATATTAPPSAAASTAPPSEAAVKASPSAVTTSAPPAAITTVPSAAATTVSPASETTVPPAAATMAPPVALSIYITSATSTAMPSFANITQSSSYAGSTSIVNSFPVSTRTPHCTAAIPTTLYASSREVNTSTNVFALPTTTPAPANITGLVVSSTTPPTLTVAVDNVAITHICSSPRDVSISTVSAATAVGSTKADPSSNLSVDAATALTSVFIVSNTTTTVSTGMPTSAETISNTSVVTSSALPAMLSSSDSITSSAATEVLANADPGSAENTAVLTNSDADTTVVPGLLVRTTALPIWSASASVLPIVDSLSSCQKTFGLLPLPISREICRPTTIYAQLNSSVSVPLLPLCLSRGAVSRCINSGVSKRNAVASLRRITMEKDKKNRRLRCSEKSSSQLALPPFTLHELLQITGVCTDPDEFLPHRLFGECLPLECMKPNLRQSMYMHLKRMERQARACSVYQHFTVAETVSGSREDGGDTLAFGWTQLVTSSERHLTAPLMEDENKQSQQGLGNEGLLRAEVPEYRCSGEVPRAGEITEPPKRPLSICEESCTTMSAEKGRPVSLCLVKPIQDMADNRLDLRKYFAQSAQNSGKSSTSIISKSTTAKFITSKSDQSISSATVASFASSTSPSVSALPTSPSVSALPTSPSVAALPTSPSVAASPTSPSVAASPTSPSVAASPTSPSVAASPTSPSVAASPTSPSVAASPTSPSVAASPTLPSVTASPTFPSVAASPTFMSFAASQTFMSFAASQTSQRVAESQTIPSVAASTISQSLLSTTFRNNEFITTNNSEFISSKNSEYTTSKTSEFTTSNDSEYTTSKNNGFTTLKSGESINCNSYESPIFISGGSLISMSSESPISMIWESITSESSKSNASFVDSSTSSRSGKWAPTTGSESIPAHSNHHATITNRFDSTGMRKNRPQETLVDVTDAKPGQSVETNHGEWSVGKQQEFSDTKKLEITLVNRKKNPDVQKTAFSDGVTATKVDGATASKIDGVTATKVDEDTASKIDGVTATKVDGATATKVDGATASKIDGVTATKVDGATASKIDGVTATKVDGATASKIDGATASKIDGATASKIDGITATKIDGATATKIDGATASKIDGATASKNDGVTASKIDGATASKIDGITATKVDGATASKIDGATASKIDGATASKVDGATASKIDGATASKIDGATASKIDGATSCKVDGATSCKVDGATSCKVDGATSCKVDGATSCKVDGATSYLVDGFSASKFVEATTSKINTATSSMVDGFIAPKVDGANASKVDGAKVSKVDGATVSTNNKVDGVTAFKVDGVTASKVDGATTSKVDGATSSKVYGTTSSKVDGVTASKADEATACEVDEATVSYVDEATVSYVDEATVSKVDETTVSNVDEATVSKVDETTVSKVDKTTVSKVDEATATVSKVDEATVSKVDEATVSKVDETTVSKVDETTVSKVDVATVSKVGEATVSKVDVATVPKVDEATESKVDEAAVSKVDGAASNVDEVTASDIDDATASDLDGATTSKVNEATTSKANVATASKVDGATVSKVDIASASNIDRATSSKVSRDTSATVVHSFASCDTESRKTDLSCAKNDKSAETPDSCNFVACDTVLESDKLRSTCILKSRVVHCESELYTNEYIEGSVNKILEMANNSINSANHLLGATKKAIQTINDRNKGRDDSVGATNMISEATYKSAEDTGVSAEDTDVSAEDTDVSAKVTDVSAKVTDVSAGATDKSAEATGRSAKVTDKLDEATSSPRPTTIRTHQGSIEAFESCLISGQSEDKISTRVSDIRVSSVTSGGQRAAVAVTSISSDNRGGVTTAIGFLPYQSQSDGTETGGGTLAGTDQTAGQAELSASGTNQFAGKTESSASGTNQSADKTESISPHLKSIVHLPNCFHRHTNAFFDGEDCVEEHTIKKCLSCLIFLPLTDEQLKRGGTLPDISIKLSPAKAKAKGKKRRLSAPGDQPKKKVKVPPSTASSVSTSPKKKWARDVELLLGGSDLEEVLSDGRKERLNKSVAFLKIRDTFKEVEGIPDQRKSNNKNGKENWRFQNGRSDNKSSCSGFIGIAKNIRRLEKESQQKASQGSSSSYKKSQQKVVAMERNSANNPRDGDRKWDPAPQEKKGDPGLRHHTSSCGTSPYSIKAYSVPDSKSDDVDDESSVLETLQTVGSKFVKNDNRLFNIQACLYRELHAKYSSYNNSLKQSRDALESVYRRANLIMMERRDRVKVTFYYNAKVTLLTTQKKQVNKLLQQAISSVGPALGVTENVSFLGSVVCEVKQLISKQNNERMYFDHKYSGTEMMQLMTRHSLVEEQHNEAAVGKRAAIKGVVAASTATEEPAQYVHMSNTSTHTPPLEKKQVSESSQSSKSYSAQSTSSAPSLGNHSLQPISKVGDASTSGASRGTKTEFPYHAVNNGLSASQSKHPQPKDVCKPDQGTSSSLPVKAVRQAIAKKKTFKFGIQSSKKNLLEDRMNAFVSSKRQMTLPQFDALTPNKQPQNPNPIENKTSNNPLPPNVTSIGSLSQKLYNRKYTRENQNNQSLFPQNRSGFSSSNSSSCLSGTISRSSNLPSVHRNAPPHDSRQTDPPPYSGPHSTMSHSGAPMRWSARAGIAPLHPSAPHAERCHTSAPGNTDSSLFTQAYVAPLDLSGTAFTASPAPALSQNSQHSCFQNPQQYCPPSATPFSVSALPAIPTATQSSVLPHSSQSQVWQHENPSTSLGTAPMSSSQLSNHSIPPTINVSISNQPSIHPQNAHSFLPNIGYNTFASAKEQYIQPSFIYQQQQQQQSGPPQIQFPHPNMNISPQMPIQAPALCNVTVNPVVMLVSNAVPSTNNAPYPPNFSYYIPGCMGGSSVLQQNSQIPTTNLESGFSCSFASQHGHLADALGERSYQTAVPSQHLHQVSIPGHQSHQAGVSGQARQAGVPGQHGHQVGFPTQLRHQSGFPDQIGEQAGQRVPPMSDPAREIGDTPVVPATQQNDLNLENNSRRLTEDSIPSALRSSNLLRSILECKDRLNKNDDGSRVLSGSGNSRQQSRNDEKSGHHSTSKAAATNSKRSSVVEKIAIVDIAEDSYDDSPIVVSDDDSEVSLPDIIRCSSEVASQEHHSVNKPPHKTLNETVVCTSDSASARKSVNTITIPVEVKKRKKVMPLESNQTIPENKSKKCRLSDVDKLIDTHVLCPHIDCDRSNCSKNISACPTNSGSDSFDIVWTGDSNSSKPVEDIYKTPRKQKSKHSTATMIAIDKISSAATVRSTAPAKKTNTARKRTARAVLPTLNPAADGCCSNSPLNPKSRGKRKRTGTYEELYDDNVVNHFSDSPMKVPYKASKAQTKKRNTNKLEHNKASSSKWPESPVKEPSDDSSDCVRKFVQIRVMYTYPNAPVVVTLDDEPECQPENSSDVATVSQDAASKGIPVQPPVIASISAADQSRHPRTVNSKAFGQTQQRVTDLPNVLDLSLHPISAFRAVNSQSPQSLAVPLSTGYTQQQTATPSFGTAQVTTTASISRPVSTPYAHQFALNVNIPQYSEPAVQTSARPQETFSLASCIGDVNNRNLDILSGPSPSRFAARPAGPRTIIYQQRPQVLGNVTLRESTPSPSHTFRLQNYTIHPVSVIPVQNPLKLATHFPQPHGSLPSDPVPPAAHFRDDGSTPKQTIRSALIKNLPPPTHSQISNLICTVTNPPVTTASASTSSKTINRSTGAVKPIIEVVSIDVISKDPCISSNAQSASSSYVPASTSSSFRAFGSSTVVPSVKNETLRLTSSCYVKKVQISSSHSNVPSSSLIPSLFNRQKDVCYPHPNSLQALPNKNIEDVLNRQNDEKRPKTCYPIVRSDACSISTYGPLGCKPPEDTSAVEHISNQPKANSTSNLGAQGGYHSKANSTSIHDAQGGNKPRATSTSIFSAHGGNTPRVNSTSILRAQGSNQPRVSSTSIPGALGNNQPKANSTSAFGTQVSNQPRANSTSAFGTQVSNQPRANSTSAFGTQVSNQPRANSTSFFVLQDGKLPTACLPLTNACAQGGKQSITSSTNNCVSHGNTQTTVNYLGSHYVTHDSNHSKTSTPVANFSSQGSYLPKPVVSSSILSDTNQPRGCVPSSNALAPTNHPFINHHSTVATDWTSSQIMRYNTSTTTTNVKAVGAWVPTPLSQAVSSLSNKPLSTSSPVDCAKNELANVPARSQHEGLASRVTDHIHRSSVPRQPQANSSCPIPIPSHPGVGHSSPQEPHRLATNSMPSVGSSVSFLCQRGTSSMPRKKPPVLQKMKTPTRLLLQHQKNSQSALNKSPVVPTLQVLSSIKGLPQLSDPIVYTQGQPLNTGTLTSSSLSTPSSSNVPTVATIKTTSDIRGFSLHSAPAPRLASSERILVSQSQCNIPTLAAPTSVFTVPANQAKQPARHTTNSMAKPPTVREVSQGICQSSSRQDGSFSSGGPVVTARSDVGGGGGDCIRKERWTDPARVSLARVPSPKSAGVLPRAAPASSAAANPRQVIIYERSLLPSKTEGPHATNNSPYYNFVEKVINLEPEKDDGVAPERDPFSDM